MDLEQLLIEERLSILERWLKLILESYSADTSKSFGQERDRFANPVGYVLTHEIEALYDGLLQEMETDQVAAPLEKIIQIRSVQNFSPSQAVSVIPLLKKAILEAMERSGNDLQLMVKDWFEFESRVDRLSLLAFDIYSKCRERISEIRLEEVRKERDRTLRVLKRMNSGLKERSEAIE